ncbi:RidA family protein [Bradyrhizobium sp. URHD0069]|uniref:RidA family protein n=1 Tax=Bradyrhizobium sp. URHD0069 TaxID=1380355 RepID=UPI000495B5E1|nr:Rid family hydrolase [Bradyrhizobium sp. URHD0069]
MHEVISVPNWNPRLTYSPAVRAGDFIYVSGTVASNENGEVVHPGDIVGQTRYVYGKIARILGSAGVELSSIVDTLEFYIPDPNYRDTAAVRRELFGEKFPTATGIPVQSLIREGALIEIKVVAYAPQRSVQS